MLYRAKAELTKLEQLLLIAHDDIAVSTYERYSHGIMEVARYKIGDVWLSFSLYKISRKPKLVVTVKENASADWWSALASGLGIKFVAGRLFLARAFDGLSATPVNGSGIGIKIGETKATGTVGEFVYLKCPNQEKQLCALTTSYLFHQYGLLTDRATYPSGMDVDDSKLCASARPCSGRFGGRSAIKLGWLSHYQCEQKHP